jgi:hypothetical protein
MEILLITLWKTVIAIMALFIFTIIVFYLVVKICKYIDKNIPKDKYSCPLNFESCTPSDCNICRKCQAYNNLNA